MMKLQRIIRISLGRIGKEEHKGFVWQFPKPHAIGGDK